MKTYEARIICHKARAGNATSDADIKKAFETLAYSGEYTDAYLIAEAFPAICDMKELEWLEADALKDDSGVNTQNVHHYDKIMSDA